MTTRVRHGPLAAHQGRLRLGNVHRRPINKDHGPFGRLHGGFLLSTAVWAGRFSFWVRSPMMRSLKEPASEDWIPERSVTMARGRTHRFK